MSVKSYKRAIILSDFLYTCTDDINVLELYNLSQLEAEFSDLAYKYGFV